MLEFASSFFNFNKCYLCNKNIKKDNIFDKYICNNCINKLDKYKCFYKNKIVYNEIIYVEFIYVFIYNKFIRKLILNYKFFGKAYLGNVFEKYIISKKNICKKIKTYDIIIPVPMYKKNKEIRGYNQTEIISKKLSQDVGITYKNNILVKVKNTKKQSLLTKEERKINVKDAYKINKKYLEYLKNKKVIIFDDIYTTGATIKECVQLLIEAGVKEILVLILAKD